MEKLSMARHYRLSLLVSALVLLIACGGNAQEVTPLAATETTAATSEPTDQPTIPPTNTSVPEPTAMLSPPATPSPAEPTEEPRASIVTYEDEDHGIILAYPDTWYIRADENAVYVFSDESLSRVTRYEEGAALFISTDTRLADLDAEAILDLFVGQLNLVSDQEAIAEPATLMINNQEAAQAVYVGNVDDAPVIVTYTAITNGQIGAVVISVMLQADEDIFGDTLASITNSITLTALPDPADSTQ